MMTLYNTNRVFRICRKVYATGVDEYETSLQPSDSPRIALDGDDLEGFSESWLR
eukprot:c42959_g1_i1 orf=385-546(-)